MQHMKNKNGFTIIELIMVMIIIGVLAAVAIPRFQDIVIESEAAVEQRILNTISNGLETYAREKYVANGVRSWPANPFVALSKMPPDYDNDLYVLSQMKDRDWVFTGDGNNESYNIRLRTYESLIASLSGVMILQLASLTMMAPLLDQHLFCIVLMKPVATN